MVAALARGLRGWTPRGLDDATFQRILTTGLQKNAPDVLREWGRVSLRQKRKFRKFQANTDRKCHPLNIGPLTRYHLQVFGAKLGYALHYHETGRPVPGSGGVNVMVNTLGQRSSGWQLPPSLGQMLAEPKTLKQGGNEVADQFAYSFAHDPQLSFYIASLGLDISLLMFVAEKREVFDTITGVGAHVHRPGHLMSHPVEMRFESCPAKFTMPWPVEQ